jgi:FKBP-type peptidyl-prolyl cis-trans isomerase 2
MHVLPAVKRLTGATRKIRAAGNAACGSVPAALAVVQRENMKKGDSMQRAEIGSTVTISYIGTLDNGRIFHSTEEQGPQTITIGAEQVFPALEQAIIGMRAGEVKNIILTAEKAYGPRRQENIISAARAAFPAGKEIVVGQKLSIEFTGGASRVMVVTAVSETNVTLDGNHPLAGLDLTFALSLDRVE